jgi:hypothetical protein
MSRQLPAQPNLEHLRKQAKALLEEWQQRDPAAQLADAQHAIAREYGFASWPKLKVHVESFPRLGVSAAPSPFAGTWTANLPKSKRHPERPFQAATMRFDVDGDTLTITDVVVEASGDEVRSAMIIHADGVERASEYGNGCLLTVSRHGSHSIETVATKDGQLVGRGTYEVSADGNTLTVTTDEQMIVLDRT